MSMANIRGFFVNLDGCQERRERLEGNLRELGMSQRHERFSAIRTHAHVDFFTEQMLRIAEKES
ncbi:hypothetical protein [Synechococcus sp. A15-127]|uniref:hypothetical protein n=1 Tax=Synechococcus sp. A15-127 TaxID=1050624 RepID=UPI0016485382|nr:hypothetical protein [Synechococcus sp. A15-127]